MVSARFVLDAERARGGNQSRLRANSSEFHWNEGRSSAFRRRGTPSMPTRDEYREKAVECIASAELMLYPAERAALLQMAHGYIMLADCVGRDLDCRGDTGNAATGMYCKDTE